MNLDLGGVVIGWREALIALIGLIALYMFAVIWRMRRLQGKAPVNPPFMEPAGPNPSPSPSPATPAVDSDWQTIQSRMAQDTFMRGMENELAQMRDEVEALRGEVAALRNELWQQMDHVRASQAVSPLYNDAMQMAQNGHDPATIAERCGIARAEAELVVALVKSQNN